MRLGLGAALCAALCAAACHGGDSGKPRRTGSARSPVELVNPDANTGPGGDEIEPNDTDGSATPLALGATIRGKIDPESDVDRYRVIVTQQGVAQAGALSVMVSAAPADLAFELEDPSGQVVAKSDRGGVRTREGVPNIGVQPGAYIAVVRQVAHKQKRGSAEAPPPPVYEITAQMVAPQPNAEREPDDDRGTANELVIGDTGTGFIGWTGDTDVWKFSVEALAAKDAIDIEVSSVDGVGFDLELDDGVGSALVHRKAPRGAALAVRGLVPAVAPGAPPYYYIAIAAAGSNPEAPYTLRVTGHVVGTDAEIEPDDSPDRAMAWPADRTVVHGTWTPGDVDCYALPDVTTPRDVAVTIDPSSDIAVVAELLAGGQVVAASAGGGKGKAQTVTGSIPAGAHAVIRIKGADDRGAAEGTYDITVKDGT